MRLPLRTVATCARIVAVLATSSTAFAQFAPGPNPITDTVNGTQTLSGGTGTVDSGGEIRIASGGNVALNLFGTSNLFNNGTIRTLGTGRAIDSNSGVANLTVNNTGLISSVSGDAFRINTNSAVQLINSGTIQVTSGGQAIDWAAISSASNELYNLAGRISAFGEDAVRPGAHGIVENRFGFITATPTISGGVVSGSDGIDLRTLSGIQVMNAAGTISGRHGIATDGANSGPSTFALRNDSGIIRGLNGSGLNIDGVSANVTADVWNEIGLIRGGVLAGATSGDGDGIDVDGVLNLVNRGQVFGFGARGAGNNAEGVAAGGGTIYNDRLGSIIGSTLLDDAPDGDATRAGNGILIDDSNGGSAVAATAIDNEGLIEGRSGFGIKIVGAFADRIYNYGVIRGSGNGATIQTGDGNDMLLNGGSIISDNGNAIDLEGGDDHYRADGIPVVIGRISGGAGNDLAEINVYNGMYSDTAVEYSGVLSDFETVQFTESHVAFSESTSYMDTLSLASSRLTLSGSNRISSEAVLRMLWSDLRLVDVTGPNAQTFAGLEIYGIEYIDLGFSSMTFGELITDPNYDPGLALINWSAATSPDYAVRFMGDLTGSAAFLGFIDRTTINGYAAAFSFDGSYTNVSAVPLPGALILLGSGLGLLWRRRSRAVS